MVRFPVTVVIGMLVVTAIGSGLLIAILSDRWNMASAPSIFMTAAASSATASGGVEPSAPVGGTPTPAPTRADMTSVAPATPAVSPTNGGPAPASTPTISLPTALATPAPVDTPIAPAMPTPADTLTAAPTINPPTATALPTDVPATTPTAIPSVVAATPTTDIARDTSFVEYVVQPGDTLYAIAEQFNVSIDDILTYNAVPNPSSLTISQTLRIPTGGVPYVEYVVQRGDLLVTIAQRFGVSVDDILAINDIRNPSSLTVGQTLRIPRRSP